MDVRNILAHRGSRWNSPNSATTGDSWPDDAADQEPQLEPPQSTIRAEVFDVDQPRGDAGTVSYGELRVYVHAVQGMESTLRDHAADVTTAIDTMHRSAEEAATWLTQVELTETGTWQAARDAGAGHIRGTLTGNDADARRIRRRRRIEPWMYWLVYGVLAAADLAFFVTLWRDVEEATSWISVETVQSLLYGMITPVALLLSCHALGPDLASLRRPESGDTGRTIRMAISGAIFAVSVMVLILAVRQRVAELADGVGAAEISSLLVGLLFLLLPPGLLLAELLSQNEDVEIDRLRTEDAAGAAVHVEAHLARARELHRARVAAVEHARELRDVLELRLNESLRAAADLIAQERAHQGADRADLLWPAADAQNVPTEWVDCGLPAKAVDPVLAGPIPKVKLNILHRLDAAIEAQEILAFEHWMASVSGALNRGAEAVAEGGEPTQQADDRDDAPDDEVGEIVADDDSHDAATVLTKPVSGVSAAAPTINGSSL